MFIIVNKGNNMYFDFRVRIPVEKGVIYMKAIKGVTYFNYLTYFLISQVIKLVQSYEEEMAFIKASKESE